MNEKDQRLGGPDVLVARVHGDSIPDLKMAALDQARDLYGADAQLRIERVDALNTSLRPDKGKFWTFIQVRCLNLPEEDRS